MVQYGNILHIENPARNPLPIRLPILLHLSSLLVQRTNRDGHVVRGIIRLHVVALLRLPLDHVPQLLYRAGIRISYRDNLRRLVQHHGHLVQHDSPLFVPVFRLFCENDCNGGKREVDHESVIYPVQL